MSKSGAILTLNAGSSSLKFALFSAVPGTAALLRGEIEDLDDAPHLLARDRQGTVLAERRWPARTDFATVLGALLAFTDDHLAPHGLLAAGHRIVHGGADHTAPALITPALLQDLHRLTPLDPLHIPQNLAPAQAIAETRPGLPQVACFDTAFHSTMPARARDFAIPRALTAAGIRRYGFHGLSYEFIAGELAAQCPALAAGKVIVAHLGSGASLCAMRQGKSVATTMGFSTLDGLVMATRGGRIDPGIILYLGRQGYSFADIEDLLYHKSGLLGVSEISGDLRRLLDSDDRRAAEAVDLFTDRIASEAGSMMIALGGLDGLVFTGGIGEHAAPIRAAVCERLAWLGVQIDDHANAANAARIATATSPVDIRVIATDEEKIIARHTRTVIATGLA